MVGVIEDKGLLFPSIALASEPNNPYPFGVAGLTGPCQCVSTGVPTVQALVPIPGEQTFRRLLKRTLCVLSIGHPLCRRKCKEHEHSRAPERLAHCERELGNKFGNI